MLRKASLFLLCILALTVPAIQVAAQHGQEHTESSQGMTFFHGTWAEVKAEAKKQNKPIFMDCFTTWCGPCKHMSNNVFTQAQVGEFYNKNFINYKVDMEKGEGRDLAKQFTVRFYPTLLYFNSNGELIHKTLGAKDVETFIKDGQSALSPNGGGVYSRIKLFKEGKRDTAMLRGLIQETHQMEEDVHKQALSAYWEKVKGDQLLEPHHWAVFHDYEHDVESAPFAYISKNIDKFTAKYGEEAVHRNIYGKAINTFQEAGQAGNKAKFMKAVGILTSAKQADVQRIGYQAELMYYLQYKDWKSFVSKGDAYIKNMAKGDAREINNLAYQGVTFSDDKDLLKRTEAWMKDILKANKNAEYLLTLALIQEKQGKIKEAEKTAQESAELAKASNNAKAIAAADELLKKIQEKKGAAK